MEEVLDIASMPPFRQNSKTFSEPEVIISGILGFSKFVDKLNVRQY